MDKYKSIDELLEEKRIEMMTPEGGVNIRSIYRDIKELAENMTLEPIYKDVFCKQFYKVGERDFVTLLYRSILSREPDHEGYINTLNLLLSGSCRRAQLIQSFANSEEGQKSNVRLIGFKKEMLKERIVFIMKKIPGVGYMGRWITNIVFLSRRMASLYHSYNVLALRCENTEQTYRDIKNQYDELCAQYVNLSIIREKYQEETALSEKLAIKAAKDKELCDTFYLHYNEKLMPDCREAVKARAMSYIERIRKWYRDTRADEKETKFVDLGCGECEWIELLSENGFNAIGVDSNGAVVEKVRRELPNMNIVLEDSIEYLRQCEDNSIDLISSFHMVEHMDFLTIITLLKECYRVLNKDGMLIVETPNPQNILTSSYYFYMDPTHVRPIPPELLQFFLEESGFTLYEKLLLNPLNFEPYEYRDEDPIKDIVFRFNMEQAYSIMAVKK